MSIESLLPHAIGLMLVAARLSGLFIFTPTLAGAIVPMRVRALLVFALALAVYPVIPGVAQGAPEVDLVGLVPMLVMELLIGFSMGLIASIPLVSINLGGLLMGQQMGLGVARVFNPAAGVNSNVLGQMLYMLALAAFLGMGGLEWLFIALLDTFGRVPVGAMAASQVPLGLLVEVIASGFELAMRVAAPVLTIILLETLSSGFVMKTMPQINILSVGFPIKISLGLIILGSSLVAIDQATGDELWRVMDQIGLWSRWLGSGAASGPMGWGP